MALKVWVTDTETGHMLGEATIPEGEYFLFCVSPCYLEHQQFYANGTAVLTIKGRTRPMPKLGGTS